MSKLFFRVILLSWIFCVAVFSTANAALKMLPSKDSVKQAKAVAAQPGSDDNGGQLTIHPIVRLGAGMLSYIGNVKANTATTSVQSPASGRVGFDLGLSQKLSPVTEFELEFLYGNLSEIQYTSSSYWNFQSTIAGGGLNFQFNILPKQEVSPFVVIGVESFEFLSRANIYDQYGNEYYSWSDGTLRSIPQSSTNAAYAKILNVNYSYSTDIRSLNLDGSGTYTQQTFAIPIGIGFKFRVGTRADFEVGSTLHYTFTDHIDGLTTQVQGPLHGTLSHDMFMFSYITLRFNLTRDHPKSHRYDYVDNIDLTDTVHPYQAGTFDTSEAYLQMQYEREMDSTGKYAKQTVDPFHWHVTNPIPVKENPSAKTNTTAAAATTNGTAGGNNKTAANGANNNTNAGGAVYKVQLLAKRVPLAEGITFSGINDKAAVDQQNGLYRYTTGNFTDMAEAQKYLSQLRSIGYTDAFIRIDYPNGKSSGGNGANPSVTASAGTPKEGSAAAIEKAVGSGLVYKIQLGVFGAIAPDQHFMSTLNQFKDLKIVKDNAGLNHYMVGSYSSYKDATAARDQAKAGGIKDVCVMAFYNGRYISNNQAQGMEKK